MWTILFGSIVNKTSHLGGEPETLLVSSLLSFIFVLLSFRYLRIISLRLQLIAQDYRIIGNKFFETLTVVINAFVVVVATYFLLFDLYHQNFLSAAQGGGILKPGEETSITFFTEIFEVIKVPVYKLDFKIPSSRFIVMFAGLSRRIFNPVVYYGQEPVIAKSAIELMKPYLEAVNKWFTKSGVSVSVAEQVVGR